MTITYGFYDSVSLDRLYNAKQMGSIFDGLILDGVYPNYGDRFEVLEATGMDVSVGTGRTWFDHTWTYNDALIIKTIAIADPVLNRIDIVYLEINENVGVRANSIGVLTGTPASSPIPPNLTNTSTIHQYALAHIYVGAGVTVIIQANITDMVGTVDTPFVELVTLSEDMQAQIYAIVGDTNPPLIDLIALKGHDHDGSPTVQLGPGGLAANAVIAGKIAVDAVIAGKIATDGVVAGNLADDAVVAGNLAANAVVAGNIASGAVSQAADLASDVVETAKIKNLNVTSGKLGANAVIAGKIADGAVNATAKLANNIVDDTKVGNRVPQLYRRQGGHSTIWDVEGATNYTPGAVRIQVGAISWSGASSQYGNKAITYPVAFSSIPISFAITNTSVGYISCSVVSTASGLIIYWQTTDGTALTNVDLMWMAIGPE